MADDGPSRRDPLDITQFDEPHRRHIVALGRVAELSAILEWQMRWVMGLALGIDDGEIIEALFLGERFGAIAQRLEALAKVPDAYGSKHADEGELREIVEWTRQGRKAMERRDALIHRPVQSGQNGPVLGRARRVQVTELLNNQASDIAAELDALVSDGHDLMFNLALG